MSHDGPDAYESDLLGFAATLTDDRALIDHLVSQAMAQVAHEPSTTDPAAAGRVWTVRGLLSDGYVLGAPVAGDVDTATDVENGGADDLGARLARSSRLQRVVVALYYGRHSDAGTIARVVGSSESDINAYLAGVRSRLGIDLDDPAADGEQSLRRLLQDLHAAEIERVTATQQAEQARSAVDLEDAHRARIERVEQLSGELAEQRRAGAADLARERDLAVARDTAAATQIDSLQARLDEQARLSAEERLAEAGRTDALIADLQQRLETAIAEREDVAVLDQQATIAELAHERDLAVTRETAAATQLESLQARLDEHVEQARLGAEERLDETARTDAFIVDLRQRLESAIDERDDVAALDQQRRTTIAELAHERDLAAARDTAAATHLDSLQARLDEHVEQARLSAEERLDETARTDAFIVDLQHRLDTATAERQDVAVLDQQRQATAAELAHERDLAAARDTAAATQLENLQARLDEHVEQARLSDEERRAETARTDAVIVELRRQLDTVQTQDQTGDQDVEPGPPTQPAGFTAARPVVFTAIGPVHLPGPTGAGATTDDDDAAEVPTAGKN